LLMQADPDPAEERAALHQAASGPELAWRYSCRMGDLRLLRRAAQMPTPDDGHSPAQSLINPAPILYDTSRTLFRTGVLD